jgi:copper chaperone
MRSSMRKFLATVAVLAVTVLVVHAGELPKGQEQTVLSIEGMTCGGCCAKVETAVAELEGVVSATADYKNGTATVTYVKKDVTVDAIIATINDKTSFKASLPEKSA